MSLGYWRITLKGEWSETHVITVGPQTWPGKLLGYPRKRIKEGRVGPKPRKGQEEGKPEKQLASMAKRGGHRYRPKKGGSAMSSILGTAQEEDWEVEE
jgi:hypothetical protein